MFIYKSFKIKTIVRFYVVIKPIDRQYPLKYRLLDIKMYLYKSYFPDFFIYWPVLYLFNIFYSRIIFLTFYANNG